MSVVEVELATEKFAECNACGSTDEIFYLKVGRESKTSLKLCRDCRLLIIDKFQKVTER